LLESVEIGEWKSRTSMFPKCSLSAMPFSSDLFQAAGRVLVQQA
jgi:hypothetical protein